MKSALRLTLHRVQFRCFRFMRVTTLHREVLYQRFEFPLFLLQDQILPCKYFLLFPCSCCVCFVRVCKKKTPCTMIIFCVCSCFVHVVVIISTNLTTSPFCCCCCCCCYEYDDDDVCVCATTCYWSPVTLQRFNF